MGGDLGDLLELNAALAAAPSSEGMLTALVDGVAALLEVPSVSVRLLDTAGSTLVTHARAGDPFHNNTTFEFITGEGLVGWVCKHKQPLRVARAEDDPRFSPRPDQQRSIGGFLGVPLIVAGQCLGVISAVAETDGHFTQRHEDLLVLIAGFFAPHLRYAQLEQLASPDAVSGLAGRDRWDAAREHDIDPLAIIAVSIDELAEHRARSGAGFADVIRKVVADAIARHRRTGDALVQVDEADVLIVLPRVALPTAVRIAERLRHSVHAELERRRSTAAPVTVSIAVAQRKPSESRTHTEARLEVALGAARERGGGLLEIAS